MKIILFDLDGTLVSVGQASKRAFNQAFIEMFQVEPNSEGVIIHGGTDINIRRGIMQKTLGRDFIDNEYELLNERYVELLPNEVMQESDYKIMPGIEELLKVLGHSEDFALGLQTGNIEPAVKPKLSRANLNRYFLFGGFGSDSAERSEIIRTAIERAKWLLDIEQIDLNDVFVVGDTPYDVRAGKAVGVNTLAVATGIFSFAELVQESATNIVADLSKVDQILDFFNFKN